MASEKKVYSVNTAAEYLGVTPATVRYHMYAGNNLKPDGIEKHKIYFYKETLDKFKNRRKKPEQPGGKR